MIQAEFRFYAGLNDFLPQRYRQRPVSKTFLVKTTLKDAVEGIGVPHSEIELFARDKEAVPADAFIEDEDRIAVYPWFTADAIALRFILDGHLGRLASYLRMLGFDCFYRNSIDDHELAHLSVAEDRILLTRDLGLLKRSIIRRGRWLRNTDPHEQLREVVEHFDLPSSFDPFTRCMQCNEPLQAIDRDRIVSRVPPAILERFDEFSECPACERVYWEGTHYQRMEELIQWLGESVRRSPTDRPHEPSAVR